MKFPLHSRVKFSPEYIAKVGSHSFERAIGFHIDTIQGTVEEELAENQSMVRWDDIDVAIVTFHDRITLV